MSLFNWLWANFVQKNFARLIRLESSGGGVRVTVRGPQMNVLDMQIPLAPISYQ
jgi:hypothetical protein